MSTISLAAPFEAQYKYLHDNGTVGWSDCQVVGMKDGGMSQTFLVITVGEDDMLYPFEVGEVRAVLHNRWKQ